MLYLLLFLWLLSAASEPLITYRLDKGNSILLSTEPGAVRQPHLVCATLDRTNPIACFALGSRFVRLRLRSPWEHIGREKVHFAHFGFGDEGTPQIFHVPLEQFSGGKLESCSPHTGNSAGTTAVWITEPQDGDLVLRGDLALKFRLAGDVLPSPTFPVHFEVVGESALLLTEPTLMLDLTGIEPGTHVFRATVPMADNAALKEADAAAEIAIECVLFQNEIQEHRAAPLLKRQETLLSVTCPGPAVVAACGADSYSAAAARAAPAPTNSTALAASVISILFVGSLTADGQRTIWLRQAEGLPREEFDLTYLTFAADDGSGNEDDEGSGNRDYDGSSNSGSNGSGGEDPLGFAARLASLGVRFIRAAIPGISFEELEQQTLPGVEPAAANIESVMAAVLRAATAADYGTSVEGRSIEPPWAARTWRVIVDAVASAAAAAARRPPDVVVFANSRAASDAVLARAIRVALGPRVSIVFELPNLFPTAGLQVDLFVAPSTYAARHPSVVAAAAAVGAPIVVIPPGVDTKRFRPDGEGEVVLHRACAMAAALAAPAVAAVAGGADGAGIISTDCSLDSHGLCSASDSDDDNNHSCIGQHAISENYSPFEITFEGGASATDTTAATAAAAAAASGEICRVLGFVGRLAPEKSPGLFIRAAALVAAADPFVRFVVVGDGPLRRPLETLAARLGVAEFVEFAGYVPPEALPALLRGMHALAAPSLRAWAETFCIANAEAMAAGVPVVGFGVGGAGDYLNAENAVLVDEATPAAVAAAAGALLRDGPRRQRLAAAARRTVVDRFGAVRQLEAWAVLYRGLAAGSGDGGGVACAAAAAEAVVNAVSDTAGMFDRSPVCVDSGRSNTIPN